MKNDIPMNARRQHYTGGPGPGRKTDRQLLAMEDGGEAVACDAKEAPATSDGCDDPGDECFCMETDVQGGPGILACEHSGHLQCLLNWAKTAPTPSCPWCRTPYDYVLDGEGTQHDVERGGNEQAETVPHGQLSAAAFEEVECYICHGRDRPDDLYLCDRQISATTLCDRACHFDCAGLSERPAGNEPWYCNECEAPRQTTTGLSRSRLPRRSRTPVYVTSSSEEDDDEEEEEENSPRPQSLNRGRNTGRVNGAPRSSNAPRVSEITVSPPQRMSPGNLSQVMGENYRQDLLQDTGEYSNISRLQPLVNRHVSYWFNQLDFKERIVESGILKHLGCWLGAYVDAFRLNASSAAKYEKKIYSLLILFENFIGPNLSRLEVRMSGVTGAIMRFPPQMSERNRRLGNSLMRLFAQQSRVRAKPDLVKAVRERAKKQKLSSSSSSGVSASNTRQQRISRNTSGVTQSLGPTTQSVRPNVVGSAALKRIGLFSSPKHDKPQPAEPRSELKRPQGVCQGDDRAAKSRRLSVLSETRGPGENELEHLTTVNSRLRFLKRRVYMIIKLRLAEKSRRLDAVRYLVKNKWSEEIERAIGIPVHPAWNHDLSPIQVIHNITNLPPERIHSLIDTAIEFAKA